MPTIDWNSDLGQRIRKEMRDELVVWMTTTSADGTPQPNPVWFVADDGDVIVYSHYSAARNTNIERNPRVALNFNSDFHADRMSVITGTATVDDTLPAPKDHAEFQQRYGQLIPGIGMSIEEHSDTYRIPIRVTPTKIRGW